MTTGKFKEKVNTIPTYIIEIITTLIVYLVLCLLCYFVIGDYITLSTQGLSTIGIMLSTSIGVLTAILVSFVLIVWQTSRRDRSESFLRWRNTLHQLFEFYDANLEKYMDISEDVMVFTVEASEAASITPMGLKRYRELASKIMEKLAVDARIEQEIKNPTPEQIEKAKIGNYLMDYFVLLTHANFDHNVAHNLYRGLLGLRGLLYRLLCVLGVSIIIVAITVTTNTVRISDIFNTPLAVVLILWVIYLLFCLGIRIKKFTRLEDEFLRQEKESGIK